MKNRRADTVVVLDFETTGLSPDNGDRAIEIGAVLLERGQIVDRFQRLMNPGFRVSSFIEGYTGIRNSELRKAGTCESAMREFAEFISGHNLVAHNASFDRRFLDGELHRIGATYEGSFCCSMLVARRLLQRVPNHQLGTLVQSLSLPNDGVYHRALADAEMTAHLWLAFMQLMRAHSHMRDISFAFMCKLARTKKDSVAQLMSSQPA